MEFIPLDATLISATGLKDVNLLSKMDVYAVVSLSGGTAPAAKQRTPVDKDSGPNPKWNHTVTFTVPEAQARQGQLYLKIKLVSERSFGDTTIGEVEVPLKDLFDGHGTDKNLTYNVITKNGKPKGTLHFSCKFGEKFTAAAAEPKKTPEPVLAYPPPGTSYAAAGAHPYAYPPPGGYGYPQAQPGYAYPMPPPQQGGYGYGYPMMAPPPQKPKRNGGNMALGLGAGLLGGLLIGDMVSDAAAYDAGFDDGFDAGGFDF